MPGDGAGGFIPAAVGVLMGMDGGINGSVDRHPALAGGEYLRRVQIAGAKLHHRVHAAPAFAAATARSISALKAAGTD